MERAKKHCGVVKASKLLHWNCAIQKHLREHTKHVIDSQAVTDDTKQALGDMVRQNTKVILTVARKLSVGARHNRTSQKVGFVIHDDKIGFRTPAKAHLRKNMAPSTTRRMELQKPIL